MKIFVSPSAKQVVKQFAKSLDMSEQGVASRLYEWFGRLPRPVQKWVIGLTDGNEGIGMKMFAEELLKPSRSEAESPRMRNAAKSQPK